MRKAVKLSQSLGASVLFFKNNFALQPAYKSALTGNTEFLGKVGVNTGYGLYSIFFKRINLRPLEHFNTFLVYYQLFFYFALFKPDFIV